MNVTSAYLAQTKRDLPKRLAAGNEWILFKESAKEVQIGSLYRLLSSFTDLLHGKKFLRKNYRELSQLLLNYGLSLTRCPELSKHYHNKLVHILTADQQLPRIQRGFPDFTELPELIPAYAKRYPGLQGVLLALLHVAKWQKSEDLVVDVVSIAKAVNELRTFRDALRVYEKLVRPNTLRPVDVAGFTLLRGLAEKHSLVGAQRSLPSVPESFQGKATQVVVGQLIEAMYRFSVKQELEQLLRHSNEQLDSYLNDLVDFFQDYPIGEIRARAVQLFPIRARWYAKIPRRDVGN